MGVFVRRIDVRPHFVKMSGEQEWKCDFKVVELAALLHSIDLRALQWSDPRAGSPYTFIVALIAGALCESWMMRPFIAAQWTTECPHRSRASIFASSFFRTLEESIKVGNAGQKGEERT